MWSNNTLSGPSDWAFFRKLQEATSFAPSVPSAQETEDLLPGLEKMFQKWFTEDDVLMDQCFISDKLVPPFQPQDKQTKFLERLLKDQKKLAKIPNFCPKLEKMLKQEISRVWEEMDVKEQKAKEEEKIVWLEEKIYVSEEIDDNFIGRLLGVRGQKIKNLAQSLGVTMFIRGQGSSNGPVWDEKFQRDLRNGYFDDQLHVLIKCEGREPLCKKKMARAVATVKKIMVQPVVAQTKKTVITGKRPSTKTFGSSRQNVPLVILRFVD